jgi:hypothetical protein
MARDGKPFQRIHTTHPTNGFRTGFRRTHADFTRQKQFSLRIESQRDAHAARSTGQKFIAFPAFFCTCSNVSQIAWAFDGMVNPQVNLVQ